MAENEDHNCKKCGIIVVDEGTQCDRCDKWLHIKCIKMSKEQYILSGQVKDHFWFCASCKEKVINFIKSSVVDVVQKDEIMEALSTIKAEIKEIKEKNTKTELSYAEVAKLVSNNSKVKSSLSTPIPKPLGGVIITSKNVSNTKDQTLDDIKKKIDQTKLGGGVTLRTCYRGEGCFLGIRNKVDSATLEKAVIEQLGDQYLVKTPTEKRPQLILSGMNKEFTEEQLINEIVEANQGFNDEDSMNIKVVHKRSKNMAGKQSWEYIMEAEENTFGKLLDRYILIDYRYHYIKSYVNLTRCYNCQKYHHKATVCLDSPVCAKCAGSHSSKDCQKQEFKCVNCIDANTNGAKYNVKHICGTRFCGFQQNMMNKHRISSSVSSKW